MQDRFKFRVWSIANKKYCHFATTDLSSDGLLRVIRPLEQSEYIDDYENRYVIQQCTGLKDKNGKLIYEGDIVIEHYYNTKETAIKKVFFDEKVIGFAYTDGIEYNQLSITDGDRLQVIGNIYENAELLKG